MLVAVARLYILADVNRAYDKQRPTIGCTRTMEITMKMKECKISKKHNIGANKSLCKLVPCLYRISR